MSPDVTLHDGAILIADAHGSSWHPRFCHFLVALEEGSIQTSQLILMGDVFDMLFGEIPATHRLNHDAITRLNHLSHSCEIIYIEGNHDFNLRSLFPNIRIIPRRSQPLIATYGAETIALLHGDRYVGWVYALYAQIIRNRWFLRFLNLCDRFPNQPIFTPLLKMMEGKIHCTSIPQFERMIQRRAKRFPPLGVNWWIEGHFHQNIHITLPLMHYLNLAPFVCHGIYHRIHHNDQGMYLSEEVFDG